MPANYALIDTINGPGCVDRDEIAAMARFIPKRVTIVQPQLVLTMRGSGVSVYCIDSRKNVERIFGKDLAPALEPKEPRKRGKASHGRQMTDALAGGTL